LRGEAKGEGKSPPALRDQGHRPRKFVLHSGSEFVLDLQVASHLLEGQHLAQFGNIGRFDPGLSLLDGHQFINELLGLFVGERIGPIVRGVTLDELDNALVDRRRTFGLLKNFSTPTPLIPNWGTLLHPSKIY
jgi:hypothetical protein